MLCFNTILGVTPCGAVKSVLQLPPFGIAYVLLSHSFAFFLSDPARAALGR